MYNELRRLAIFIVKLPVVDASKDPADNFLLAKAQAGVADVLVTGDKHDLLSLGTFRRTQIITARQFLTQLGDKAKRSPKRKIAATRRRKRKTSRYGKGQRTSWQGELSAQEQDLDLFRIPRPYCQTNPGD